MRVFFRGGSAEGAASRGIPPEMMRVYSPGSKTAAGFGADDAMGPEGIVTDGVDAIGDGSESLWPRDVSPSAAARFCAGEKPTGEFPKAVALGVHSFASGSDRACINLVTPNSLPVDRGCASRGLLSK